MIDVEKAERKIELKKNSGIDTTNDEALLFASMIDEMISDKDFTEKYEKVKESFKEQEDTLSKVPLPPFPMMQVEILLNTLKQELDHVKKRENLEWHLKYIGIIIEKIFFVSEETYGYGKTVKEEDVPEDHSLDEWIENINSIIKSYKRSIQQLESDEIPYWAIILWIIESNGYRYIKKEIGLAH